MKILHDFALLELIATAADSIFWDFKPFKGCAHLYTFICIIPNTSKMRLATGINKNLLLFCVYSISRATDYKQIMCSLIKNLLIFTLHVKF